MGSGEWGQRASDCGFIAASNLLAMCWTSAGPEKGLTTEGTEVRNKGTTEAVIGSAIYGHNMHPVRPKDVRRAP
jgi:hypothetical protein